MQETSSGPERSDEHRHVLRLELVEDLGERTDVRGRQQVERGGAALVLGVFSVFHILGEGEQFTEVLDRVSGPSKL